jgi:broad specificity phosphatase PhoE
VRDCDYGRWSGQSLDALQAEEPLAVAQWLDDPQAAPPGGESLRQVLDRVATWLEAESRQPRKTIVITHAAVIRAAIIHAIGAPPRSFWRIDVAPLSRTTLTVREGRWTLRSIERMSAEPNDL